MKTNKINYITDGKICNPLQENIFNKKGGSLWKFLNKVCLAKKFIVFYACASFLFSVNTLNATNEFISYLLYDDATDDTRVITRYFNEDTGAIGDEVTNIILGSGNVLDDTTSSTDFIFDGLSIWQDNVSENFRANLNYYNEFYNASRARQYYYNVNSSTISTAYYNHDLGTNHGNVSENFYDSNDGNIQYSGASVWLHPDGTYRWTSNRSETIDGVRSTYLVTFEYDPTIGEVGAELTSFDLSIIHPFDNGDSLDDLEHQWDGASIWQHSDGTWYWSSNRSYFDETGIRTRSFNPDTGVIGSANIYSFEFSNIYPGESGNLLDESTTFQISGISIWGIPEPSSMLLSIIGFGVLFLRRRRLK